MGFADTIRVLYLRLYALQIGTNWSLEELFYKFECTVFSVLEKRDDTREIPEKITLIVHDMGSYFGYMFAFLYPDLIENFIGLDIGYVVFMIV